MPRRDHAAQWHRSSWTTRPRGARQAAGVRFSACSADSPDARPGRPCTLRAAPCVLGAIYAMHHGSHTLSPAAQHGPELAAAAKSQSSAYQCTIASLHLKLVITFRTEHAPVGVANFMAAPSPAARVSRCHVPHGRRAATLVGMACKRPCHGPLAVRWLAEQCCQVMSAHWLCRVLSVAMNLHCGRGSGPGW